MNTTTSTTESACGATVRREIGRFLRATRGRGELDTDRRRRGRRRCHRSWPLLVSFEDRHDCSDTCVALHNASPLGIAFLYPCPVPVGTTVLIKLFWHDEFGVFVPAVVRHASPNHYGFIIGCAFAIPSAHRAHGRWVLEPDPTSGRR